MSDELVFTVDKAIATPAEAVTLPQIGLTERADLQEWVIAHPAILGANVMIVTFEFDRWWSTSGNPADRLDVLGLDRDGRLVVCEMKRDVAPETVEMQAVKYAAMVSRFTPDTLASQFAKFRSSRGEPLTDEAALERLEGHLESGVLNMELLRQPRIVLLAASFPPVVSATAVWLREMGVDMTLMRFQAYRTSTETLVTVSQLFPLKDVEDFTVVPRSATTPTKETPEYPWVEWQLEDYQRLSEVVTNPTVLAILNLASTTPDTPFSLGPVCEETGRSRSAARADLAGLTQMVKKRFGRSNWPFKQVWGAGGEYQAYYQMTAAEADLWLQATQDRSAEATDHADDSLDAGRDGDTGSG